MKIKREAKQVSTFKEFSECNDLTLEIKPRDSFRDYTARWENVETKERLCFLVGVYGYGNDEADAVLSYVKRISNQFIVYGAGTKERKDLETPVFNETIEDIRELLK